jgi:hypothetical protein
MFGPVTCIDGRQFIEMAKYNHLRRWDGQKLINVHHHIYAWSELSLMPACFSRLKSIAGCSECPTFSPSQPRRAKTRRSAGKAAAIRPNRLLKKVIQRGRRRVTTGGGTHRTSWGRSPIQWILANGKTPPVLPTSEGLLFNVEDCDEPRTKLGTFFSSLLVGDDSGC